MLYHRRLRRYNVLLTISVSRRNGSGITARGRCHTIPAGGEVPAKAYFRVEATNGWERAVSGSIHRKDLLVFPPFNVSSAHVHSRPAVQTGALIG